nr:hypothetical protein [uncultured Enterobacter sp.]
MTSVAIYRVITGGYDNISSEIFKTYDDNTHFHFSYFFISDNPVTVPAPWQYIQLVRKHQNPAIDNRELKLKIPPFLREFDYTIYLDGNIIIKSPLNEIMQKVVRENNLIYAYPHYRNPTLREEIVSCFIYSRITFSELCATKKLLSSFLNMDIGFECGVIIRKKYNEKLKKLGEVWFQYYFRNAKRDQFYFLPSLIEAELECNAIGENMFRSSNGIFKLQSHKNTITAYNKIKIVLKIRLYNLIFGKKYV